MLNKPLAAVAGVILTALTFGGVPAANADWGFSVNVGRPCYYDEYPVYYRTYAAPIAYDYYYPRPVVVQRSYYPRYSRYYVNRSHHRSHGHSRHHHDD